VKDKKEARFITDNKAFPRGGVHCEVPGAYHDVLDPAIWLKNNHDLVAVLKCKFGEKEEVCKRLQLRFSEDGDGSLLSVWDGGQDIGHLAGQDLKKFLLCAFIRTTHSRGTNQLEVHA
jgi:hypothetical protein